MGGGRGGVRRRGIRRGMGVKVSLVLGRLFYRK